MKKEKIIIISLIICNLLSICFLLPKNSVKNIVQSSVSKKKVSVDIKGAVKNPGLKVLEIGTTVNDLIIYSGGLLENADTSLINLSKKLTDEMVVIVYTTDEVKELKTGSTSVKVIEQECICPQVKNDACISNNDLPKDENNNISGKVNINKASKEELMTLSGIGETKAIAIIEYRKQSPFKTIEEITNVNGIGSSTFEKIKNNLTI